MTENSIQILPIGKVKINPDNPRTITDDAFKKLVKSIKDFPDMLTKRPIVVNNKMIILGGNKRYEAAVEAGLKEIPVIVTDWNKKQQQEFLIKDNTSFGEWDWQALQQTFDFEQITDWGVKPIALGGNNVEMEDDGLPEYEKADNGIKLIIRFETEAEIEAFCKSKKIKLLKKQKESWSTIYPFTGVIDAKSVVYE